MRLLITGWQGQVARSLVEAAANRSDVAALAIGRPALDVCLRPSILRSLADHAPDIVINTAAYTAVDTAESEPEAAFALNRDGAALLADAAQARNIPIVHLSTDYVFDGSKSTPYTEEDSVAPLSVYGRSKLEGEQAVIAHNSRHVILRTSWIHSPFGANFVKSMLKLASEREVISVVDDQLGSPTYAGHLAEAILNICRAVVHGDIGNAAWGVFHAAGSGEATWCGLARGIFARSKELGGPCAEVVAIATSDYPTAARRPINSRLDTRKLSAVFGISLPDWQVGVDQCVGRLLSAANEVAQ
jgi:dTDP-4-dehydrorhamnose reductase